MVDLYKIMLVIHSFKMADRASLALNPALAAQGEYSVALNIAALSIVPDPISFSSM